MSASRVPLVPQEELRQSWQNRSTFRTAGSARVNPLRKGSSASLAPSLIAQFKCKPTMIIRCARGGRVSHESSPENSH